MTQVGQLVHPTKGVRVIKDRIASPVRDRAGFRPLVRKLTAYFRGVIAEARARILSEKKPDFWRERYDLNALVNRMTNWQRTQYSREKKFTRERAEFWLSA